MLNNAKPNGCVDLCPPVRNRYFYGKLLDVGQFDLEQSYLNGKRWMLNRLVSGYGVVCGLNVLLGPDNQSIVVSPGVAIDKCGHEIMVCQPSGPQTLPAPPQPPPSTAPPSTTSGASGAANAGVTTPAAPPAGQGRSTQPATDCCGQYVTVSICYHECLTDPVPGLGGDCDTQPLCSPGAVSERYRIMVNPGGLPAARTTSRLSDVLVGGVLSYQALANYVTGLSCENPCTDCCIPLATVRIPDPGQTYEQGKSIDISVRPICYTNDLLYELILAMQPAQSQATAGKP
jgi:hypothetical protein